jgi:polyisoprenoid-binding protein YceI
VTTDLDREPDALSGTWTIDPVASHVTFAVPYALLGRIRGRFTDSEGLLVLHHDVTRCSVLLAVDAASVHTGPPAQDQWLRSAAFLDTDTYPYIWFHSTQVAPHPNGRRDHAVLTGELTIRDVTRPISCAVQLRHVHADNDSTAQAEFTGRTRLSRAAFGVGTAHDSRRGGILLGDQLTLDLDIRAVRQRLVPLR